MPSIDVALLPAEALSLEGDCYIVVDLLRATTTIAILFDRGLSDLIVAGEIGLARGLAARDGRILLGEVGGLAPEGFDHGNSPVEVLDLDFAGRGAVLFTTNGTRALCGVAGRGEVLAGALANATAVSVRAAGHERIVIVCAGLEGGLRFGIEDFAAAGILVHRLTRLVPGLELGDAAGLALTLPGYENWIAVGLPQQTARSARLVAGSRHGRTLARLGLSGDIQFALREDTSFAVPIVTEWGEGWARLEDAR